MLISAAELERRVSELGAEISRDYRDREPLLIGVLRGAACFMSDLMRHISLPLTVDYIAISSYNGEQGGAVEITKDVVESLRGRDVIVVEDIVDTGMTLNTLLQTMQSRRPASLKVCTLLDNPARRLPKVPIEYCGFVVPDEFVVGYGLDFRQKFRNLPFIATLKNDWLKARETKKRPE